MHPLTTTFFLIHFLLVATTSSFSSNASLPNCTNTFSCGTLENIGYPFSGALRPSYCGLPKFQLTCLNDNITVLNVDSLSYIVKELNQTNQELQLARSDFNDTGCTNQYTNTSLNSTFFTLTSDNEMLYLFYGCNDTGVSEQYTYSFSCDINGSTSDAYYVIGSVSSDTDLAWMNCDVSTNVPISKNWFNFLWSNSSNGSEDFLGNIIRYGFVVNYSDPYSVDCAKCSKSGGLCGFDSELGKAICICGDRLCSGGSSKTSLGIGLGVAGAAVFLIGLGAWILLVVQRRKRKAAVAVVGKGKDEPTPQISSKASKSITTPSTNFSQTTSSFQSSKSTDIEKGSTYFGVQLFSYSELEQATENFNSSKELGDGGFGTVYYGVLQDGRVVAVKRLYENNMRRAEQFMNEIEILARLRHPNLVTLYGCTSRRCRELLLVYEYIPNGTVADHLNGKLSETSVLTWPIRLSIAIETAEALAFLHAQEVIHRDVKTNNILLDKNFCVKVADFGLSRLFPNDVTHVSTAPQGTPGYVDPEYYQCYQLTDKSDVYSFGVVLIELISSLPAVDTSRHRQDINLANMAVNKIQNHALHELVDPSLGFETDYAVRRMATSVAELAFRCLQQERDMRPIMEEVLESLKRVENENYGAEKVEIVDIGDDDVGLLRNLPPPLSPDSAARTPPDKWDKMVKTF